MAIPRYDELYDPILKFLADGEAHSIAEIRSHLISKVEITPDELQQKLPSGRQTIFDNRVG